MLGSYLLINMKNNARVTTVGGAGLGSAHLVKRRALASQVVNLLPELLVVGQSLRERETQSTIP